MTTRLEKMAARVASNLGYYEKFKERWPDEIPGVGAYISSGREGDVYELGNNVIKFMKTRLPVRESYPESPCLVKVLEVKNLGPFPGGGGHASYIVMERLFPLDQEDLKGWSFLEPAYLKNNAGVDYNEMYGYEPGDDSYVDLSDASSKWVEFAKCLADLDVSIDTAKQENFMKDSEGNFKAVDVFE